MVWMAYGCEKHYAECYGWLTGVKTIIRNGTEACGCEKHRTECFGWPGLGRDPPGLGRGPPGLGLGPALAGARAQNRLLKSQTNAGKRLYVQDGGKSHYEKLRRVMNFLFYGKDNLETYFKKYVPAKLAKHRETQIFGSFRN